MTSKRKYQVSVILINYNSSDYTIDCIKSIHDRTSRLINYQIIVVDNNSRVEEINKLINFIQDKQLVLLKSKINVGFSAANMMGVQVSDADYYYFLNNDTLLLNDCISILFTFLESNLSVANCSGEMFNEKNKYEYNFRYFPTLWLKLFGSGILRFFLPEKFPDKYKQLVEPTSVDLISGSSMFIRASAFEEIGGFDTNYFLYCEEEDIALRLYRAGKKTYLLPKAKYQHFENKSSQSVDGIRLSFLKEFYISLLYYYSKNYGFLYRLAIQILFFFKTIRKFYKNWDYVKLAFFIAGGAHMKHSLRFKQRVGVAQRVETPAQV